jgi:ABC-type nitrate/sulfonate/bicarbonate transport system substrate-binding protein
MKKFKIGGVPEHFNYPWRKAIEENAFNHLNVSLHWSDMTGGTGQMIKGLETGTLDIAVLLTEGITRAILQGTSAKIIDVYVTSPLQWGVHVPFNSKIDSVNEFINPRVAISRYGSGSHLMAYVLGQTLHWDCSALTFNVIGDVYGGIWSLEHEEADLFLWEKYTTQPFVDKQSCKRIGQVNTPWPCFVVACRASLMENDNAIIQGIIEVVKSIAKQIKADQHSAEAIAWRYHLAEPAVAQWLNETTWNTTSLDVKAAVHPTVEFLHGASLINDDEKAAWETKLF